MRHATAALIAALALVCAGCGSGGGDDGVPAREQVVRTVRDFARATASKDYPRLCRDLLADELVTRIQRAGVTCRDALRAGLHGVRDPHLTIGAIVVDGDSATAEVHTTAAGQQPSRDRLRLAREHGRWRIASLGGP